MSSSNAPRVGSSLIPGGRSVCIRSGQNVAYRGPGRRGRGHASAHIAGGRLELAQRTVDDQPNEIAMRPDLLHDRAPAGGLVTVDAVGCQHRIAHQVLEQGGDSVPSLKDNQSCLAADVQECFAQAQASRCAGMPCDYHQAVDKGRGWLADRTTTRTRSYLLSRPLSAPALGEAVRGRWGIEHQGHWMLDVSFGEDQSRIEMRRPWLKHRGSSRLAVSRNQARHD
ncbi:MAG: ISAs1 family transposase [Dehalococcoidia bacterium]